MTHPARRRDRSLCCFPGLRAQPACPTSAIDESVPGGENRRVVSPYVGLWRSWERASMAWKRSSVRSRSGPPNNPFKIKQMPEAEHSLPSMTLCHFVSRARTAFADY
jgi:hypothetical protein